MISFTRRQSDAFRRTDDGPRSSKIRSIPPEASNSHRGPCIKPQSRRPSPTRGSSARPLYLSHRNQPDVESPYCAQGAV
jgi:hypothetical protein